MNCHAVVSIKILEAHLAQLLRTGRCPFCGLVRLITNILSFFWPLSLIAFSNVAFTGSLITSPVESSA